MSCSTRIARPASWVIRLFLLTPIVSTLSAYSQQTTIRSQANVVLIPALVKDAQGEVVYGLGAQDFIVDDEGVPQPLRLDEAPEGQPVSMVVAVQTGRRAAYEFPRSPEESRQK